MIPVITDKATADEKPVRVGLSTAEGIMFVATSTIIRCEALNNYTRFYFVNDKPILICHTLGYFEEKLIAADFIRIHRKGLINKKFILKYCYSGELWLTDGSKLKISRRRKREVLNAIAC